MQNELTQLAVPVLGKKRLNDVDYFVVNYRGEECYVKMFPYQAQRAIPANITCIFGGKSSSGKPKLKQDITAILEDIYEAECSYEFIVREIQKDPKSSAEYLLLDDEYGLHHRLYKPKGNVVYQKKIECYVEDIYKGYLVLKNDDYQLSDADESVISAEEMRLFQKLHDDKVQDAKTFNKPAYRQYWNSIVDKYPDSAHFIYELLQNADDAGATNVEIFLSEQYLIFKHNGIERFTISDVADDDDDSKPRGHINAITGIGFTTKSGELSVQNKIGKFGVGFKAVFQYTDRPEIYDDTFRFSLENYIIPTLIKGDHVLRKPGETLFFFPFKKPMKAYEEIYSKLRNMDNPILFLNNIQKVSWQIIGDNEEFTYNKSVQRSFNKRNIVCELIKLQNVSSSRRIWMFTKKVTINNGGHNISVGYYLNEDGHIDIVIRPPVHCFFPTKEKLDLCIISHAPFLLTDSRQNIKDNEAVNKTLMQELATLAADALPILRDIGLDSGNLLIDENILEIVPVSKAQRYMWETVPTVNRDLFFDTYLQVLRTSKLIVNRNKEYLSVDNCRIANPINIQELISDDQLQLLARNKSVGFVFSDVSAKQKEKREYLTDQLDIQVITSADIASMIKGNKEFMTKQPDAWLHRFYYFLYTDAIKLWKLETAAKNQPLPFRESPIIRTNKGDFVAPYDKDAPNVFYSTVNFVKEDLSYVDSGLLSNTNTQKFFDELGIREYDKKDTITQILVRYEKGGEIDDEVLRDDLCFIYDYCSNIASYEERRTLISEISSRLNVVYTQNGDSLYGHISSVYDIKDHIDYFGKNADIQVLDYDFYKDVFDKYNESNVLHFLHELGLRTTPKVTAISVSDYYKLTQKQRGQVVDYSKRPTYGYQITDYQLDGLIYALENRISYELSKKIWSWLCEGCPTQWILKCVYMYTNHKESRYGDASIYLALTDSAWLYNENGQPLKPKDISWVQLKNAGYKYNEDLLDFLGILSGEIEDKIDGLTDEQQEIYDLGRITQEAGVSKEELMQLLESAKRKKLQHMDESASDTDSIFSKDPLREVDADEMFANNSSGKNQQKQQSTLTKTASKSSASLEERMNKFLEFQEKEREQEQQIENLRDIVETSPKYSKEWFEALLELEYKSSKEDITAVTSKAISISFQRVDKEKGSDRIFILKNPAKPIPLGIEEVGGITVKFQFSNKEEIEFSFEVASVRDFTLRLKAKIVDIDLLDKIDWAKCTLAEININNPVELIGKLRGAFAELDLPDGYNLKDNIRDDIEFIFGPPGTGKTTYLSKYITRLINENANCKILVLAPTNKACDVLTTKVMSTASCDSWLRRFVACGDQSIANKGLLCDRDSDIYNKTQCCVVSTIARLPYDGFDNPRVGLRDVEWDYVIIDEASMIPIAQIVYAIYKFAAAKVIIAGDPFQISPIVREEDWVDESIYTMVNLNSFTNPSTEPHQFKIINLDTQYRSLPAVGTLFSEYAYNGMLKHYRHGEKPCDLVLDGMDITAVNFIPFRVEKYDSIYGPRKLSGSNVQIYSVLLTVEFVKYVSKQWYEKHEPEEFLRIGVICPYAAQAQLIDTMLQQRREVYPNIDVVSGTIHGFQGDECDIIITVLNTPKGLKGAPDKIFLNRKNILNVAISRARDYLFVLIPHVDTDGYENLNEIQSIGDIANKKCRTDLSIINADIVEGIIFNDSAFIEKNTFVTSHQMANVYTDAQKLYEVRIDENAVDIQINAEFE